jgi:hypothetical protein
MGQVGQVGQAERPSGSMAGPSQQGKIHLTSHVIQGTVTVFDDSEDNSQTRAS